MNKKRNTILLMLMLLVSVVYAQRIGIQGAGVLSGLQQESASKQGEFNILTGAVGGFDFEWRLKGNLSLSTAALFEFRAARYDISWYKPGTTYTRILYYGQVPLYLNYRLPKNKINWLYYGGPRVTAGLFGSTNEHYYLASRPKLIENNPFGGANSLHRMELYFDAGFGLEVQQFQFKLHYGLPLVNNANVSDLSLLKQHQLQLTVGVTLRKLKPKKDKVLPETTAVDTK